MSLWSKKEAFNKAMFVLEDLRSTRRMNKLMRRYPQLFSRSQAVTDKLVRPPGAGCGHIARDCVREGVLNCMPMTLTKTARSSRPTGPKSC